MRYRFGAFALSTATRALTRDEAVLPLIPRYFDLLVLLLARRREAVSRQVIFDAVWSDVVVSEGALSQAIRTLRRTLGDDPREPRFIRTVSRHGYQFVWPCVEEEDESTSPPRAASTPPEVLPRSDEAFERALGQLLGETPPAANGGEGDARLDAAVLLHTLGTDEALRRLDRRPGHERARALLRDTRWEVPNAGPVPLLGENGAARTATYLVLLRVSRALREIEGRWAGAAAGGALVGIIGGALGGILLVLGPGSRATAGVPVVLALLGGLIGGVGAAGVGAGLAAAEAVFRSTRGVMLIALGAAGGGAVGAGAHLLALLVLEGLFGRHPSPLGGALEGLVIGAGTGLGYALATHPRGGGMAAPRGLSRLRVAGLTGLACAAAGLLLSLTGCHTGAMSLDFLARSFPGSQVGLDPLARLLGESAAGPLTTAVISSGEGLLFGLGVALGLTRRPRAAAGA